jgi:hypothetical protein
MTVVVVVVVMIIYRVTPRPPPLEQKQCSISAGWRIASVFLLINYPEPPKRIRLPASRSAPHGTAKTLLLTWNLNKTVSHPPRDGGSKRPQQSVTSISGVVL